MSVQISQFFRSDGTLISIPVKNAKKIAVLNLIASQLKPEIKYSEKQINALIGKFHEDSSAIRRHMIEYGILARDRDSNYWIAG